MTSTEQVFVMPDLGEGLEEGEIVAWLVSEGDTVALNQPLVEVETAKATVEVPSPYAGVVARLHGTVGSAVPVGSALVTFALSEGGGADSPGNGTPAVTVTTAAAPTTPPVRRLAKDLGVDLASIRGSGPGGRITADDVRTAVDELRAAGDELRTAGDAESPTRSPSSPRAAIAANLERQAAIPQVTTFRTVDCSALERFRRELGLSPLPIVIAALCRSIETHPTLNAGRHGGQVVRRPSVHVGLATDTDRGLVVPVVRDAGARGIAALATEIERLARAARTGSLLPDELTGATIAVSNTGSYGSEAGTPILSPGTSVTLALGVIAPRALVVDGDVVARPACTLSCTFDHRVLDGAVVGRGLIDLVETLSSPERLGDLPR